MFISGYNTTEEQESGTEPDLRWRNQSGFWYLEVLPVRSSGKDCPIKRDGLFGRFEPVLELNPRNTSSCNLYDFRLVIFNDLNSGANVHFHGLTPPSNQDGVPFVANANIHPQNLQSYRFNQFTYPGLHWMHAHTGFQQAFGVAAPIVLQHSDLYFTYEFSKEDDLVVMFEEGFIYPLCAYSGQFWYTAECMNIPQENFAKLAFLINRREEPLEHTPNEGVQYMRIRFLNGGSEAPWRITDSFSETNGGVNATMELLATDGQDVVRGITRREFVLGLANRIDVLIKVDPTRDTVITGVQMKHSGNVTSPALRHIIIHGRDTPQDKKIQPSDLPTFFAKQNSPILENFNLLADLTAAHPFSDRIPTRNFTIVNRGGDQFGGYKGLMPPEGNSTNLDILYDAKTYTELNQLKFQLPPLQGVP